MAEPSLSANTAGLSGRYDAAAISVADRLAIRELLSRHFYALDGLTALVPGDAAVNWAVTFTPDGRFTLVRANGEVVVEVQGRDALASAFRSFPDVDRTRHWINDLLIEPVDADTVDAGCYIIALDVGSNPAPIIRTGVYIDRIVRLDGEWRYQSRRLILDPASPAA
jgi:hypothetical protein